MRMRKRTVTLTEGEWLEVTSALDFTIEDSRAKAGMYEGYERAARYEAEAEKAESVRRAIKEQIGERA